MSLVDAWAEKNLRTTAQLRCTSQTGAPADSATHAIDVNADAAGTGTASIFSLEPFDAQITRGRGQVMALAAASDHVIVITSRAYLLRYNYAASTNPVLDLEFSKASNVVPLRVFLDSTGAHAIITFTAGGSHEAQYLHYECVKPRPLPQLRGTSVSAVAFDTAHSSTISTGEVLVGTETGSLHVLMVDEKERRERLWLPLGEVDCAVPAVTGAYQQVTAGDTALVLVATAARLYVFLGGPGLQGAFAGYASRSFEMNNFVEQPLSSSIGGRGQLALYSQLGGAIAKQFSWLVLHGVFCGNLTLDGSTHTDARGGTRGQALAGRNPGRQDGASAELQCLTATALHPFPDQRGAAEGALLSVAMTEYHVILLYPDCIVAINTVSGAAVQRLHLADCRPGVANPLGLATDAATATVYLFTGDSLFEVSVEDEGRDMWAVHLQRREWRAAFRAAGSTAQRNAVNCAEADAAMADGEPCRAAALWGKVTSATPSFEEVALRLVETADPIALQTFLLTRLHTLGTSDKAQATMVATWLTELYLDQINRALLDVCQDNTAADANHGQMASLGSATAPVPPSTAGNDKGPIVADLEKKLLDFMREHVGVMDPGVTCALLASYGRLDDLMHFASFRHDSEAVVEHLVGRGEASRALPLLRRPDTPRELIYKFAPPLMAAAAEATVDFWLSCHPPLEPRRLLPALLRLGDASAHAPTRRQALRYLEFALDRLQCQDGAVAALAVALYAAEGSEARLLAFLKSARTADGRLLYDPHAALRVCRDANCLDACVELLCEVQAYDDAVAVALSYDRALATSVARRPEDEARRRTAWLAIASHLFASQLPDAEGGGNIEQVGEFLAEADGAVKIEDILPLFPDFAHIDAFKGALRDGLQQYDAQIQSLRSEMDDATRIADALRRDMAALEKRTAAVDLSELCASCSRPLAAAPPRSAGAHGGVLPPMLLFPTGNAFHGACACFEAAKLATPPNASRIHHLQKALARATTGTELTKGAAGGNGNSATSAAAAAQLDTLIATEDPFSGESVIRMLTRPFIDLPTELSELQSWAV